MCMGIPMRVVASDGRWAIAEGRGERHRLDCALVGPQAPGTWLLAFVGSAREVLDEARAAAIDAALDAVSGLVDGAAIDLDACFPDLAGREPSLPAHLRKSTPGRTPADAVVPAPAPARPPAGAGESARRRHALDLKDTP